MRKVLLVIDDYSEMVGYESLLRRLGFDVLSIGKEVLVDDAILRFKPEIVIASHKGRAIDGVRVAESVKRKLKPIPAVALTYYGAKPQVDSKRAVDALIGNPIKVHDAIDLIAKLANVPSQPLKSKYDKMSSAKLDSHDELLIIGSKERDEQAIEAEWDPQKTPGLAAAARSARSDRYDKFLEQHDDDVGGVLPHEAAAKAMKKLRQDSASEKEALDKLDEEKRAFAKALFSSNEDEAE